MASTGGRAVWWVCVGLVIGKVMAAIGHALAEILMGRQP